MRNGKKDEGTASSGINHKPSNLNRLFPEAFSVENGA